MREILLKEEIRISGSSSYLLVPLISFRFETSSRDESSMAHAMKRLVEYILETEPSLHPLSPSPVK